MKRVLFVCTGNICRSPTAEGIALAWIERSALHPELEVDSAGTHGYHVGEAPDPRTQRAATRRGYDLSRLRARRVEVEDFARFDLILAMDRGHVEWLQRYCPPQFNDKIGLFLRFARHATELVEVPDPYYGGDQGFEKVLDLCEDAVIGLIEHVRGG